MAASLADSDEEPGQNSEGDTEDEDEWANSEDDDDYDIHDIRVATTKGDEATQSGQSAQAKNAQGRQCTCAICKAKCKDRGCSSDCDTCLNVCRRVGFK